MGRESTLGTGKASSVLTVTEVARSFAEIVNRAFYRGERFVLTKGGRPVAELVPAAEGRTVTAAGLASKLGTMPRLADEDATGFEHALEGARSEAGTEERDPWASS